jgi:integrase
VNTRKPLQNGTFIFLLITERLPSYPVFAYRALTGVYRALTGRQANQVPFGGFTLPTARISKRTVDALACEPGTDRTFLWDDALRGFGAVAFPTGRKAYVIQYRQNGRSRRVSLGEHGRLTPEEARSQAKILLGTVEKGADPVEERRAARAVRTFAELAAEFMRVHVRAKRKPRTVSEYQMLLDNRILPALGSKRIVEIRRSDVSRLHAKMSDTPLLANRAVAVVSSVWNWAARREEVSYDANPARFVEKNPEQRRERFLTTEELGRLGDALREGETVGIEWQIDETKPNAKHVPKMRRTKLDPHAAAALRLLILTGARLREILHARWEWVDFERGMMHLPDSKTGRKPVYLSAAALQILADLPRVKGNLHLFPGEKEGEPRADLKKPWAAVKRAAGLEGVRLHDLRHSFASVGAGASLGLPIIGKLLGHTQAATTQRYAHLDADPMRRAANAIAATIAAAIGPMQNRKDELNASQSLSIMKGRKNGA